MQTLNGSMVALVTPFTEENKVDYKGFELLINRQIRYGTPSLFVLGSCGEANLLSMEEKHTIIKEVVRMVNKRVPVFFNVTAMATQDAVDLARYVEQEGGDGIIVSAPAYFVLPQTAVYEYLHEIIGSVSISAGIYNNPARNVVNIRPETIAKLCEAHPNFVVDKEAMGSAEQIARVKQLCGDKVSILVCDNPKYSILLPNLAMGGNGSANVGGNIIPEEIALCSRPWDEIEKLSQAREIYMKYYPFLEALYWFTNPIVIKAALNILGLPAGHVRKPHMDLAGERLERLRALMDELGIIDKYGV